MRGHNKQRLNTDKNVKSNHIAHLLSNWCATVPFLASNDETSLTSLGRVSSITFPEIVLVFAAPFRDISPTRNVTCSCIVLQEARETRKGREYCKKAG